MEITDRVNSYWFKVKDDAGRTGYVTTQNQHIKVEESSSNSNVQNTSDRAKNIIEKGMKYLGTPYKFGSSRSNTETFDCSDFVRQAFKEVQELFSRGIPELKPNM
ncbi:C40 family peptidase [Paenibacillus alginolyticus]|uniref:SH3 domain-containing protein n=1 Tax=Paenibacillus alginolyticus TaxID=59839 RepID=UPI000492B869|nr:C40 family peptidase [Paenibacillus alginolyticus]MCY9667532.1 C40 family peptidase [Paenibacillus alginolyticus]